jgi:hypothetical protein
VSLSIKVSTYIKWKSPCLTAFKRGRRIETRAYDLSTEINGLVVKLVQIGTEFVNVFDTTVKLLRDGSGSA